MQTPNDHDLLIQLDERLKSIDKKLDAHLSDNGETVRDHEDRLVRIETELAVFKSQVKVVGVVAGGVISVASFAVSVAARYLPEIL